MHGGGGGGLYGSSDRRRRTDDSGSPWHRTLISTIAISPAFPIPHHLRDGSWGDTAWLPYKESIKWPGTRRSWGNGRRVNQGQAKGPRYNEKEWQEDEEEVEDRDEATSPLKPGQGKVRDAAYVFNVRGGRVAVQGNYVPCRGRVHNNSV